MSVHWKSFTPENEIEQDDDDENEIVCEGMTSVYSVGSTFSVSRLGLVGYHFRH